MSNEVWERVAEFLMDLRCSDMQRESRIHLDGCVNEKKKLRGLKDEYVKTCTNISVKEQEVIEEYMFQLQRVSFEEQQEAYVYSYLYSKMNGKCSDNPSGQVFEIKECVRKGKYSNNRMPVEVERLLLECDIPEWYVESMKKIRYLFPKTHIIAGLKRDICKYVTSGMV